MPHAAASPLESLQKFLSEAGVSVSDAIEIREEFSNIGAAAAASTSSSSTSPPASASASLRVVVSPSAGPSIPTGTLLATIPKDAAVLSARNSVARDALEAERVGGGLALLLATLVENALGERSRFFDYLRSLPPRGEYLPVLWPQSAVEELLRGTSLSPEAVAGDRERVEEDWREEAVPFARKHAARLLGLKKEKKADHSLTAPGGPFSLRAFFTAATWAASRAFGVDDDHGQALVPLADAFNHAAKVVKLSSPSSSPSSSKSGRSGGGGGFEVERACLEQEEEEEEGSESESESEEEGEDDADDAADDGRRRQQPEVSAPPRRDGLALDIAICGCDDAGESCLAIYAASELEGGGSLEVYNCYGELGNRELLSKYGFCLPEGSNPFDAVPLRPELLVSSLRRRRLVRWLRESSDLLDDEDGDDLTVSAGGGEGGGEEQGEEEEGHRRKRSKRGAKSEDRRPPLIVPTLSPSLRAALTVLCASPEEADSWDRKGEKDEDDFDALQVALAPRWWREGGREEQEGGGKGKSRRRRRRPPMLGPLPLTPEGLRSADPPLPSPLALEVLSSALRRRIGEYGPEPDYGRVLASWGKGEEEGEQDGERDDKGDGGDEGAERRARAERAVRASALLRRGELSLLRQALEATQSLLLGEKRTL